MVPTKDMYEDMRSKEAEELPQRAVRPVYAKFRRMFVDWMAEIADEFSLSPVTLHSAVNITDRVVCSLPVSRSRFQLIAMAAILIAAKLEEPVGCVPKIRDLCADAEDAFSPLLVRRAERMILNSLRWRLLPITSLHFFAYFRYHSKDLPNLIERRPLANREQMRLRRYMDFFVEMTVQGVEFLVYRPSLLAASSVCLGRLMVGLDDPWPPFLCDLSSYAFSDIEKCVNHLRRYFVENFPQSSVEDVKKLPSSVVDAHFVASTQ